MRSVQPAGSKRVNQNGRAAGAFEVGGQVDGERGLAGAASLGDECDRVHGVGNAARQARIGAPRKGRGHCQGPTQPRCLVSTFP